MDNSKTTALTENLLVNDEIRQFFNFSKNKFVECLHLSRHRHEREITEIYFNNFTHLGSCVINEDE